MVNQNELRIGNWVRYSGTITPLQIDAYSFARAADLFEDYDPIPITSEILEKAGFENHYEDYGIKISPYAEPDFYTGWFIIFFDKYCSNNSNDMIFSVPIGDYRNQTDAEVKYLHQLQNLYFALTGEELPIKELSTLAEKA